MSHVNCIALKIYQDETGTLTKKQVLSTINSYIETGIRPDKIIANPKVSLKGLSKSLESLGHTVRNGISGGCYGSRDGKSYAGLTVWLDASQFPERFIDSDGDEVVNIFALIEQYGGTLVEGLEGDAFVESCEGLGISVSRNNTYNYAGNGDSPYFLFNADFSIIYNDEKISYLVIKFHCGGDIRGNYTATVVYKFESIDDLDCVMFPVKAEQE